MIKIFSTAQAKELDHYTIKNEPISSVDLMERASEQFVREFTRRFSRQTPVTVFAGPGNNGGDALAIARLLSDESYKVDVYLFNPQDQLTPDCASNRHRLLDKSEANLTEVKGPFEAPILGRQDVVIDGLFGSGLNRPLEGGFAGVVKYINQSNATVVSIDIPSGLFGEDNQENRKDIIIRADLTLTFGFPKLAFLLPENAAYVGVWKVLDIGIHPVAVEATVTPYMQVSEEYIASLLQMRNRFAHKGNYGHALLIAGSRGKMGASLLAARACLRSGAGLLTAHIPQRSEIIFQTAFPEAMLSFDIHMDRFTNVPDLTPYSAIAVGPGLGQSLETVTAFERLLDRVDQPLIIDADGLNILSAKPELLSRIPAQSILTPHPKEFDRLCGESANDYERLQKARSFAAKHSVNLILKGAYTALCTPDGMVYFNNSGNPGMATAGSGDVLTGILLGFLSQKYEPKKAALLGVYIHGLAGDLAAAFRSEESMIAGDITEMLGKAFKQLE